ncbi:MAG: aspartyl protease family protein [Gammaproteobacteria bacterium]|nr:aspartyl protease family protein [Gammaproteobacteria bacterium]NNL44897.1 PDZ domain-containing protein [Woeseiaceae bacterium]
MNFIVDTGSPVNVIDREIAEAMGLQKIGEKEVLSGGVEPLTADIVVIPSVIVDGLTIKNAEFLTLDLNALSLGQLQGVLGMTLFRESLITFDPANDRIVVSQSELTPGDAGVIAYDQDSQSGFQIEVEVVGQPVKMNLDTGAPSSFTFPLLLGATIPMRGELRQGPVAQLAGGKRSIQLGTVDGAIEFGAITFENPQVAFIDPSAPHGNIGNAVLRELVLSIDQRNGLLMLRMSEAPNENYVVTAESSGKPRRLGMQIRSVPAGSLPTVTMIESGSLSERAGLKIGDVLVSVNEQPMQELELKELGPLFKSATPLRFKVERNGEPLTVEIR